MSWWSEDFRLGYGAMRIAGTWNPAEVDATKRAAAYASLDAAYEAGYRLFDHADIYAQGACESLFGEWLALHPGIRSSLTIATKCGIRFANQPNPGDPGRYDFSPEYVIASAEASRARLGIEKIDLFQLHRPDFLMDPAEVMAGFADLHSRGIVAEFGVSNFTTSHVDVLGFADEIPVVVNQIEFSLWHDQPLDDGTLDQCQNYGMSPLAWSPLAGGFLGRPSVDEPEPDRRRTVEALEEVAKKYQATPSQVALAWLLRHPSGVVPIIGSTQPESIRSATEALGLELSREDWYRLLIARRGAPLP